MWSTQTQTNAIFVLAFLLCALGQEVELTASSQFNMILSPVPNNGHLDSIDLKVIEDGISTVLVKSLDENTEPLFLDLEAVVQDSELLISTNEAFSSSKLRFFVLVTNAPSTATEESPRLKLNELIQDSFSDLGDGTNRLIDILNESDRPLFANVTSLDVAPLVPVASPNPADDREQSESSPKRLSTLDIVLIAVSLLIFIGILYMIIIHHKDRGYIENLRVLAANRPIRDTAISNEVDSTPRSIHVLPKPGIYDSRHSNDNGGTSQGNGDAPSTPSTIHSNTDFPSSQRLTPRISSPPDFPRSRNARTAVQKKKQLQSTESKDVVARSSSETDASAYSTTESFDSSWFASSVFSEVNKPGKKKSNSAEVEDSELPTNTSDSASVPSEESDDLFLVDVESSTSGYKDQQETNGGSNNHSSSNKTAISDWMKSIRVVSSPCKTSEMTQSASSNEGAASSSSSPSQSTAPEDCATLEQRSLEHSLASSKPDAPRPRPKFVEV